MAVVRLLSYQKAELCFQFNEPNGPKNARLNNKGGSGAYGGWKPYHQDIGQWIQVDLGDIAKVTKIATQGMYYWSQWVKTYKVSYSLDGGYFRFYQQPPYNIARVSLKDNAVS